MEDNFSLETIEEIDPEFSSVVPEQCGLFDDWLTVTDEGSVKGWDDLPDINLYMDQVIKYMQNELSRSKISDSEKNITSSMINNYTKEGVLPRPERKRYSKKHLASLMIVCLLKQVLPIQSVKQLFGYINVNNDDFERIYTAFCNAQERAYKETAMYASEKLESNPSKADLSVLAIELASKANALRVASERLIEALDEQD